jgi:cell division protein FtsL
MKAIVTLILVVALGTTAAAQKPQLTQTNTVEKEQWVKQEKQQKEKAEQKVVRLHKFRTSRVKKALAFKTKKNKAKLA